jgi:hypothetical protein
MNTSLVAILPVLSVLVIGAQILGATTLQYFGLALVIGLTSGAYSSIFIASPILAVMKEREPRYQNIRSKLANRADRTGLLTPRAAALTTVTATAAARAGGRSGRSPAVAKRQGEVLRPGSAARTGTSARPVTSTPDELSVHDEDGAGVNGAGSAGNGAARPAGGAAKKRPASASGGRRPPPRPRKGKGKGKGGRRR